MPLDFDRLFLAEELRLDGSNFVEWYLLLREVLHTNALVYVSDEPIEERPNVSASHEDYMEWLEQNITYLKVEWLMCTFMNDGLSGRFKNPSANEIVDELKDMFIAQVRVAKFECLNEFISIKMEENTCLEQHLRKMHAIHYLVVHVLNYDMTPLSSDYNKSHG